MSICFYGKPLLTLGFDYIIPKLSSVGGFTEHIIGKIMILYTPLTVSCSRNYFWIPAVVLINVLPATSADLSWFASAGKGKRGQ